MFEVWSRCWNVCWSDLFISWLSCGNPMLKSNLQVHLKAGPISNHPLFAGCGSQQRWWCCPDAWGILLVYEGHQYAPCSCKNQRTSGENVVWRCSFALLPGNGFKKFICFNADAAGRWQRVPVHRFPNSNPCCCYHAWFCQCDILNKRDYDCVFIQTFAYLCLPTAETLQISQVFLILPILLLYW